MKLTILIPCLNEETTLEEVIKVAKKYLKRKKLDKVSEIIVCDNNSSDNSVSIAKKCGAKVVIEKNEGYGSTLINGIKHARGEFIIMGDADLSYDFNDLDPFIEKLEEGYDLVVGNRFKGGIEKGAMPFLHKLGVPALSLFGNILFRTPIKDYHGGLRAFKRESILKLNLKSEGMEFASEMICVAQKSGLKLTEVPTKLYKDKRNRKSHIKTFKDGFRHLSCMVKIKLNKY